MSRQQKALVDVIAAALMVVEKEIRTSEEAVKSLDVRERSRIEAAYPEGLRWRALSDESFLNLSDGLKVLMDTTIEPLSD